jgi:5'-nucleotidase
MQKIVYVDMDNVLVDFQSGVDRLPEEVRARYASHPDDVPGIFALMDPMPGALESYRELAALFDTFILSTAPWKNPSAWSDKLLWVERHLGDVAHKRLILTHHKDLNAGDYLIDDRPNHGAERFGDRLIRFGSRDYPDWRAVMRHMRSLAREA